MKISESRKKRFVKLVEKHRSSNMSITDFCIKHKIHKWTFWYWRKKVLNEMPEVSTLSEGKSATPVSFLPVITSNPLFSKPDEKIEIHYPSGVHICLPISYDVADVRILISEPGSKL